MYRAKPDAEPQIRTVVPNGNPVETCLTPSLPAIYRIARTGLDGVGVTRRGTVLVSTPVTGEVHAFQTDGTHRVLRDPEGEKLARFPADINVCYPAALEGEPALLVPDVSMLSPPGEGSVAMVDISGL